MFFHAQALRWLLKICLRCQILSEIKFLVLLFYFTLCASESVTRGNLSATVTNGDKFLRSCLGIHCIVYPENWSYAGSTADLKELDSKSSKRGNSKSMKSTIQETSKGGKLLLQKRPNFLLVTFWRCWLSHCHSIFV